MRSHRQKLLRMIVAATASFAAAGCQQSAGGNGAPSASVSSGAVAQAFSAGHMNRPKPRAPFARHSGLGSSLFRAAHDLDLSPAQQQSLGKLEAVLKADDDGVRAAMAAFRADLVAGVRPGRLDPVKLAADDALVDRAVAEHEVREAGALEALHALLDPSQRAALVTSVREKWAERESRMAGWMRGKDDGGLADPGKRRLERLTADLSLDVDQQKQAAGILARAGDLPSGSVMQSRLEERKRRTESVLTAFSGDAFDAKTLDLTVLPGKTPHDAMDHMVAFFSKLLPILYANQRDKLADSLDRPFGAGGHPGTPGSVPTRSPADDIAFPYSEPVDSQNDDHPRQPSE